MNAYMYQCLTHKKMLERIDESEFNVNSKTPQEVSNIVQKDMQGFKELFSNKDDEVYEHLLREKFKIAHSEDRFRLDHSPDNKNKTKTYKNLTKRLQQKIEEKKEFIKAHEKSEASPLKYKT
jgi:Flp pilus assembly CpaF family ATPase